MILAALLFISRVASTTTASQVTDEYVEDGRIHILQDKDIPFYATIFRLHGPFLFGATDKISTVTKNLHTLPPVVILRLRNNRTRRHWTVRPGRRCPPTARHQTNLDLWRVGGMPPICLETM